MKNRITHVWDAIEDDKLRARVRKQQQAQAQTAWNALRRDGYDVQLRIVSQPHPTLSGVLLGHLILFVGELPALVVASGRSLPK